MSSSMVSGTHSTIPGLLFSSGSHGWKGNTVHFFVGFLSIKTTQMLTFYFMLIIFKFDFLRSKMEAQ
ncbi:hypothetical protein IC575_021841 [Cucumis melo]